MFIFDTPQQYQRAVSMSSSLRYKDIRYTVRPIYNSIIRTLNSEVANVIASYKIYVNNQPISGYILLIISTPVLNMFKEAQHAMIYREHNISGLDAQCPIDEYKVTLNIRKSQAHHWASLCAICISLSYCQFDRRPPAPGCPSWRDNHPH